MAGKKLEIEIGVDASDGIKGVKQFSKAVSTELGKVEDDFDETATAGQKVAKALGNIADQMDTELKGAAKAADALKTALGDIGGKADVSQIVVDLKRMGLTFDEIAADADELAVAIKKLDDVQVTGSGIKSVADETDRAADSVKHLGGEADNSRSVLANMAGNTSQDLGELGGVAGTAGMAIGQLAEYATEGNISLSGLASVAGPMAGLTAVTILATEAMKEHAERAEVAKKNTEAWADAIAEGGDAVQNLTLAQRESNEELEATRKLSVGAYLPFISSTEKLNDNLAAAGLTVEQFNQLAVDGDEAIGQWAQAQLEAGLGLKDTTIIVDAARASHEAYEQAQRSSAASAEIFALSQEQVNAALDAFLDRKDPVAAFPAEFGRIAAALSSGTKPAVADLDTVMKGLNITLDDAIGIADGLAESNKNLGESFTYVSTGMQNLSDAFSDGITSAEDAADAVEHLADVYGDTQKAANEFFDDQRAAADSTFAVKDAADDLVETMLGYKDAIKDAKGDQLKINDALKDSREAAIKYADATLRAAQDTAKAHGTFRTAEQDQRDWTAAMVDTARFMTGPQRQAVEAYISQVTGIPESKVTEIVANPDLPSINAADALLDEAARDREATIKVVLTGVQEGINKARRALADAGLIITGGGTSVAPTAPVATPLGPSTHAATAAVSSTSNFNISITTRANARDTVRELDRWTRVNGGKRS